MFNATGLTKSLTLPKIIGGISKTLQIANQMIPLYQKAKPLITNARSIMSINKDADATSSGTIMKDMGKNSIKTIEAKDATIINKKESTKKNLKKEEAPTSPTFFL